MDIRFSRRAGHLNPSPIRNKMFDAPDIISFSAGKPDAAFFPWEELTPLVQDVLEKNNMAALQYSSSEGLPALRKVIADKLMKNWGVNTDAESITMTSGSQEGIEMSARLFVNDGDAIIVERPSYTGAYTSFQFYDPRYISVPMDEEGMLPDALEEALKNNHDAKLIYTVPDFQNPTGITMGGSRRRRVAELAAKYRVPVVEDCPYSDLLYDGERSPVIKGYDEEGWVITLGTFSKVFCPGMRLGWICADRQLAEKYALIKQGTNLQSGTLDQYITLSYLENHDINERIRALRDIYRVRRDLMLHCIEEYFPKDVRYIKPVGGFFIWVELRDDIDTEPLLYDAAAKIKVTFVPGAHFFAEGTPHNYLRLSYSSVSEEQIKEGISRLGGLLHGL